MTKRRKCGTKAERDAASSSLRQRTGVRTMQSRTRFGDHLTTRGLRTRRFGFAARPVRLLLDLGESIASLLGTKRRSTLDLTRARIYVIEYGNLRHP